MWGGSVAPRVDPVHFIQGEALGTTWSVKWVDDAATDDRVRTLVDGTLGRLDERMSTWRPDSEMSRLNRSTGLQPVSLDTGTVIRDALDIAKETQGAFDPTVGPLMELWGVHGARRTELPSDALLNDVQKRVGYAKVRVDLNDTAGQIDLGGTQLDLSAIAKGTGVDWVATALEQQGIDNYMVEVGGEMRLQGNGVTGVGWRVAVDDPTQEWPERAIGFTLQSTSGAIATSGNYRNQYVVDGQTVVHTMDPRTGRPKQSNILSTTVLAEDCQTADAAATALMVMSVDEGQRWVQSRPDVHAAWFLTGPDGIVVRATDGMDSSIQHIEPRFKSQK